MEYKSNGVVNGGTEFTYEVPTVAVGYCYYRAVVVYAGRCVETDSVRVTVEQSGLVEEDLSQRHKGHEGLGRSSSLLAPALSYQRGGSGGRKEKVMRD